MAIDALGRTINVVPIAAGVAINYTGLSAVTYICTGNDTFTITVSSVFGSGYATPGSIITLTYTCSATSGTAKWVKATQSASNAVVISSGAVAFTVHATALADPKKYVKVSVGASGLVTAIAGDLLVQRGPANLPALSAA